MRDTLENLYFGNIAPNDQIVKSETALKKAMEQSAECEEKLTALLEDKEKTLLLRLINAENEIGSTMALDQKPKRRRGRDGSAAWSPSHDALRQPVPARPSARQGISAACVLRRCDAAERLQAHGPLHAHRPARPTAAGCGGGLSARVFADGGRGRAAPGEAAAEAVDGRVVPLGVFQPAQRLPHSGQYTEGLPSVGCQPHFPQAAGRTPPHSVQKFPSFSVLQSGQTHTLADCSSCSDLSV